ncbi:RusA family crossover junction endodeoxyribonuclease [Providencia rettgeri]|uniref:RusA family crossover junction endodeoxyribonuclease n=1 Tax=Providencia rettgeri TaxID=587 RepID=UPI001B36F218|nr:RusA family crossover junction endodeoxyribonuclease [Providencia rettgeri]EJD6367364.1 RusA family crossover junction endodeoxyribonuclease [Providencia rettgeri]EJD6372327.1 RusA family crossover junction endodeoxyribonuclease [Providencia rettgeri]ELR5161041.1 RusA family crossover junction endodeoxyribonuclease [Providencia rettgeri]ELR5250162.1 RusA family crossover junction endodeoxyribonuclease [Providencia rettgeri]EMB0750377.1 RusA family crossover junction endodeoxyribonuclease [P
MNSSITLILPFPPSVNACWRNINGKTLISAKGRAFRANAAAAIYEQLRKRPKAITEHVSVIVKMYPPSKRRMDIDNYLKAPFDALTHAGVWNDDDQVKHADITWCEVVKDGRFEIEIRPFNAEVEKIS